MCSRLINFSHFTRLRLHLSSLLMYFGLLGVKRGSRTARWLLFLFLWPSTAGGTRSRRRGQIGRRTSGRRLFWPPSGAFGNRRQTGGCSFTVSTLGCPRCPFSAVAVWNSERRGESGTRVRKLRRFACVEFLLQQLSPLS